MKCSQGKPRKSFRAIEISHEAISSTNSKSVTKEMPMQKPMLPPTEDTTRHHCSIKQNETEVMLV